MKKLKFIGVFEMETDGVGILEPNEIVEVDNELAKKLLKGLFVEVKTKKVKEEV